jgi:2-C-methyl-D-erythritol 4-phosphate cytidylyltransferase
MGSVWTIVVAAGSASRFGQPKQYQPLGDRRVLDWSLRAASSSSDGVALVVPPEHVDDLEPLADLVVAGGTTRSESVRAGLAAVPADAEVILIHDGARPLASPDLFADVTTAVWNGAVAVVPAMPVIDTVRSHTSGLVDRRDLVVVQTPQAFHAPTLREAHASTPEATDDATLVESIGGEVRIVSGSPTNLKITYPTDLLVAEALLPGVSAAPPPPLPTQRPSSARSSSPDSRAGRRQARARGGPEANR